MGQCTYCDQPAGLLRAKHGECETKHLAAVRQIEGLVLAAAKAQSPVDGLKPELQMIAQANHVSAAALNDAAVRAWEAAVEHFLGDGDLDETEEKRLTELTRHFGFSQADLDRNAAYTKVIKAAVLRDLMAGVIPKRAQISGAAFNLQKKEQLVWLFNGVDYLEDKTRREYIGRSSGVSVRVMKGVYYRVGAFKGQPVERTERVFVDRGALGATDKHLYFAGPAKGLRIAYNKVVSFTPFSDGIGVMRDASTAKPQIFVTGDGWFTYNLLTNLARF